MKTKNLILMLLTLTTFVFVAIPAIGQNIAANDSTRQDTILYICSMHPEIILDHPGKCPKCGMDLVLKNSSSSEHKMDMMMMCPMHGMMPMDHKHDEKKKDKMDMMMMCPMHGMMPMDHKHDEKKKNKMGMMGGMGIAMGAMMVVMMTVMIIIVGNR